MMGHTLRSAVAFEGVRMAGARSLWRANGMTDEHFGRPIVAIANSFTEFVPGHVHLQPMGRRVKRVVESLGFFAAEFNTIAVDDGIAMGHAGMLYSLPSRDLIADSVEYMANAHRADALVCISNCDKITPGMLIAAMRLNIPTVFVSGGPMEAGDVAGKHLDLIDAMVMAGDPSVEENALRAVEQAACPTCGSCSGMFTANSMNCLTEALGLSLPGNGTLVATHKKRGELFDWAARRIVALARRYYEDGDDSVLPRSIADRRAFENAMRLDIAMGGSTNTVLHILAAAQAAELPFSMSDIDQLSRETPNLCKVAPSSSYHVEDVHRAGGVLGIMAELDRLELLHRDALRVDGDTLQQAIAKWDVRADRPNRDARDLFLAAPEHGERNLVGASQDRTSDALDLDRVDGCIRDGAHAYSSDGGLAILYGNLAPNGCVVKTAGVDRSVWTFSGTARVFESQDDAVAGILDGRVRPGDVVVIRYEGPKGGPGMQEMLYPTSYLKTRGLDKVCALITDGRFSGGTSGLSIGHVSPEAAAEGPIALVADGDRISIDIPQRAIRVEIDEATLQQRRRRQEDRGKSAWTPAARERHVSDALRVYAHFVGSADTGAYRVVP